MRLSKVTERTRKYYYWREQYNHIENETGRKLVLFIMAIVADTRGQRFEVSRLAPPGSITRKLINKTLQKNFMQSGDCSNSLGIISLLLA